MFSIFQFSVIGMTCLASLMLAMADQLPLAGVSVPMAIIALFFTERWKVFALTTFWANALGVLAFVATGIEFLMRPVEVRVLAGAHLLAYLTWIVLFQNKSARHYWAMCALGILQVALGAVLTANWIFGALLIAYIFLAIWTLSLFSLLQAQHRFDKAQQFATIGDSSPRGLFDFRSSKNKPKNDKSAAVHGNGFDLLVQSSSMSRGMVQQDSRQQWINTRFFLGVVCSVCISITIGLVSFALIPRLWFGQWSIFPSSTPPASQALTGFTEEVQLGDIGEILESTETALEVRLFDNDTGEQLDVQEYAESLGYDEPLFRGNVLGEYAAGRWKTRNSHGRFQEISSDPKQGMIRQDIRMQPIGTPTLLAIQPIAVCRIDHSNPIAYTNNVTSVMIRNKGISNDDMLAYAIYSWKVKPNSDPSKLQPIRALGRRSRTIYTSMPSRGLNRLRQLAREVAQFDAPTGRPSNMEMARKLESYLRDSGEFEYSLNAAIHDASIDPVEDFLFNRKYGHCEYFASALALMLRSVEIPSRLISGFKGGDKHGYTGSYIVQHRHAHSWVEGYIDGRWVVFDAIPAGRRQSVDSMVEDASAWQLVEQAASMLWSQNVVGMTLSKQKAIFYRPIQERANRIAAAAKQQYESIADKLGQTFGSKDFWFTWQGYAIAFTLLSVLAILLWLMLWLARKAFLYGRRKRWLRGEIDDAALRIEFYERFLNIIAALGLSREPTQTHREFSRQVESELGTVLQNSNLSDLPLEFADQFNRVRFGAIPLKNDEIRTLNESLSRLEHCLASPSN